MEGSETAEAHLDSLEQVASPAKAVAISALPETKIANWDMMQKDSEIYRRGAEGAEGEFENKNFAYSVLLGLKF